MDEVIISVCYANAHPHPTTTDDNEFAIVDLSQANANRENNNCLSYGWHLSLS